MSTALRRLAFLLLLHLLLLGAGSARAEDEFSSYTKALVDVLTLFTKLDAVTAERMAASERYVLAKSMLRLSAAFYQLRTDKKALYDGVLDLAQLDGGADNFAHTVTSSDFADRVRKLQGTQRCLSRRFNDVAYRLAPLIDLNGADFEAEINRTLDMKYSRLRDLLADIGLDSSTDDAEERIVADSLAATEAADKLYRKTAELAHVLDPSVPPPEHPPACTDP